MEANSSQHFFMFSLTPASPILPCLISEPRIPNAQTTAAESTSPGLERSTKASNKKLRMKAEYLRDAQESLRKAKELQKQREEFFQEFAGQFQGRGDSGAGESHRGRGDVGRQMDGRDEDGRQQRYDDNDDLGGYYYADGQRGGARKEEDSPNWMNPMAISLGFMVMVILAAIVLQNRVSTNFLVRER